MTWCQLRKTTLRIIKTLLSHFVFLFCLLKLLSYPIPHFNPFRVFLDLITSWTNQIDFFFLRNILWNFDRYFGWFSFIVWTSINMVACWVRRIFFFLQKSIFQTSKSYPCPFLVKHLFLKNRSVSSNRTWRLRRKLRWISQSRRAKGRTMIIFHLFDNFHDRIGSFSCMNRINRVKSVFCLIREERNIVRKNRFVRWNHERINRSFIILKLLRTASWNKQIKLFINSIHHSVDKIVIK